MPAKPKTLVRPGIGGVPTRMTVTYLADVERREPRQLLRKGTGRTSGRRTQAAARCGFGSLKGLEARARDLA